MRSAVLTAKEIASDSPYNTDRFPGLPPTPIDNPGLASLKAAGAPAAIDALYASDDTAPPYWQDKPQLRKELRGVVRRLVQPLELDGWAKEIPLEVEHYAVLHYATP